MRRGSLKRKDKKMKRKKKEKNRWYEVALARQKQSTECGPHQQVHKDGPSGKGK